MALGLQWLPVILRHDLSLTCCHPPSTLQLKGSVSPWSLFQLDMGSGGTCFVRERDQIGAESTASTASVISALLWTSWGLLLFLKWGSRRIWASPSVAVKVMKLRQHTPCSLGGPWAPAVMEAPVATWAFWFSSLPSWEGLDGIAVTRREKCLTNPDDASL